MIRHIGKEMYLTTNQLVEIVAHLSDEQIENALLSYKKWNVARGVNDENSWKFTN